MRVCVSKSPISVSRPTHPHPAPRTRQSISPRSFHTSGLLKSSLQNFSPISRSHHVFATEPKFSLERAIHTSKARRDTAEPSKTENQHNEPEQADAKEVKIKELETEVAELKQKLVLSYAERENIRRIGNENVQKEKEFGISSFAKQMLEVADNLNRCITSISKQQLEENQGLKVLYEGVELTEKELMKTLSKNGIERFEPLGEKFDPNKMNALSYITVEGKEPGTVAFVAKSGYTIKSRLLRPADVAVVKPLNA